MANEKEVRERSSGDRRGVCSASGNACVCGAGGGCAALQPQLDKVPKKTVRELRATRLLLEAAIDYLDGIEEPYELSRRYPCPEVREIRRKLATSIAMIDEIGGEL